jgi:hypothetical protein
MLTLGTIICGTGRLGIGDLTFWGWTTTFAFVFAALLCLVYAFFPTPHKGHRLFWITLGLALLVLGMNRQIDLQWLLHEIGKEMAEAQGWSSKRRVVEIVLVAGFMVATVLLLMFVWRAAHRVWQRRWLAFCGIVLLVAFVVLRAMRIHEVYALFNLEPPGRWLRTILECGGAFCIGVSAALGIIDYRKTQHAGSRFEI